MMWPYVWKDFETNGSLGMLITCSANRDAALVSIYKNNTVLKINERYLKVVSVQNECGGTNQSTAIVFF